MRLPSSVWFLFVGGLEMFSLGSWYNYRKHALCVSHLQRLLPVIDLFTVLYNHCSFVFCSYSLRKVNLWFWYHSYLYLKVCHCTSLQSNSMSLKKKKKKFFTPYTKNHPLWGGDKNCHEEKTNYYLGQWHQKQSVPQLAVLICTCLISCGTCFLSGS